MPLTLPPSTYANQINFTPAGNITADKVQSAIEQLDTIAAHNIGNESIGGLKRFTDTTEATNSTTGTKFDGGVGVAKNLHVGGNFSVGNAKIAARRTANQSLNQGTTTRVIFNIEDLDSANVYDNSTGICSVNSLYPGHFLVSAYVSIVFNSSTADIPRAIMAIYKNGTGYAEISRAWGVSSTNLAVGISSTILLPSLVSGDNFDIRVVGYHAGAGLSMNINLAALSIVKMF